MEKTFANCFFVSLFPNSDKTDRCFLVSNIQLSSNEQTSLCDLVDEETRDSIELTPAPVDNNNTSALTEQTATNNNHMIPINRLVR